MKNHVCLGKCGAIEKTKTVGNRTKCAICGKGAVALENAEERLKENEDLLAALRRKYR